MTATATTCPHIGPAAAAALAFGRIGLLEAADDFRLALAIADALREQHPRIPLGKVTTDFDAIRAELTALIHGRIADRFDPAHLTAVEQQSRALRERLGERSS